MWFRMGINFKELGYTLYSWTGSIFSSSFIHYANVENQEGATKPIYKACKTLDSFNFEVKYAFLWKYDAHDQ